MENDVKVVYFTFDFQGKPDVCPDCGMIRRIHDYKDKTWRNENIGDSVCYIHARVPRFQCLGCGCTAMAQVPWADPNVSYTRRFMEVAIEHMSQMSIATITRLMVTRWNVLDGIVDRVVNRYLDGMDLSGVRRIRVDETSAKKNHRYITVITDANTDNIIFITKGKNADTVREFKDWLLKHNGKPYSIELVSMDFGDSFSSGIRNHFPRARIVRDPFHLIQIVNRTLDRDRASGQVNGQRLKNIRYALLKDKENLKENEKNLLTDFEHDNETVARSYQMKESIRDAISYTADEIELTRFHFVALIKWLKECGTKGFKALGKTIESNLNSILEAIESCVNNGFQEGLNGRIQLTKALARGYHRETHLARIYFRDANRCI